MLESEPNVLVLTLRTDENEFAACCASIKQQQGVHCDHVVFSELPNKLAHDTLYRRIMSESDNYDYFVKLDADMVFCKPDSLRAGLQLFHDDPELDHAQFALSDWYTNRPMMGLHIFTKRSTWSARGESLFVDYRPEIPGRRRHVYNHPAPLADHSPDPSAYQAFLFGVHRGSKVYQLDRFLVNGGESRSQWQVLEAVWQHYADTGDRRLALALLGSEAVRNRELLHQHYNKEGRAAIQKAFDQCKNINDLELRSRLKPLWDDVNVRKRRWRSKVLVRDLASRIMSRSRKTNSDPQLASDG